MLYTAGEILVWMVLAFALGIAVGWFVWGYRSKTEAAKAAAEVSHRIALAQQEADQSRAELQELLAIRARDTETLGRLRARVTELESQLAATTEERAEAEERAGAAEDILEDHEGWQPVGDVPGMAEAHEILGKPVNMDDLKVVEGIGPQIEEVLQSAGIALWATLATASVEQLRGILDAAGPQYHVHDPSSWPQQAVLALGGHWEALRSLQDNLRGGRA